MTDDHRDQLAPITPIRAYPVVHRDPEPPPDTEGVPGAAAAYAVLSVAALLLCLTLAPVVLVLAGMAR